MNRLHMSRFDSQRFRKLRLLIEESIKADEEERSKFARCMERCPQPEEESFPSSSSSEHDESPTRIADGPVEETQDPLPLCESECLIEKEQKIVDIGEAIKTAKKETLQQLADLSEKYRDSNRAYYNRASSSLLSYNGFTTDIGPMNRRTYGRRVVVDPVDKDDNASLPSLSPSSTLASEGEYKTVIVSTMESAVMQWGRLVNGHDNATSPPGLLLSRHRTQSNQEKLQSDDCHLNSRVSIGDDDTSTNPSGRIQLDSRLDPLFSVADDSSTHDESGSAYLQEQETLDSEAEEPKIKSGRHSLPAFTTLPALLWALFLFVLLFPEFFQPFSAKPHSVNVRDLMVHHDQQPDFLLLPNATSTSAFIQQPSSLQCFRPRRNIFHQQHDAENKPMGSLSSRADHPMDESSPSTPTREEKSSSKLKLPEQRFHEGQPCRSFICRLARRFSRLRRSHQ